MIVGLYLKEHVNEDYLLLSTINQANNESHVGIVMFVEVLCPYHSIYFLLMRLLSFFKFFYVFYLQNKSGSGGVFFF